MAQNASCARARVDACARVCYISDGPSSRHNRDKGTWGLALPARPNPQNNLRCVVQANGLVVQGPPIFKGLGA
jgi:hypothetical protein